MLDSLSIAASGMDGQQQALDAISNNLANINTVSYKKSKVEFANLIYTPTELSSTSLLDVSPRKGGGLEVLSLTQDFTLGDIKQTGQYLDLAINGSGFFEVLTESGEQLYTRNGDFRLNAEGYIVTADDHLLASMVRIPADAVSVKIDASGEVLALMQGDTEMTSIGKIELAYFTNPAGLEPLDGGRYQPTEHSGDPDYLGMGDDESSIAQGYLEISNVSMIEELTSMMLAQQAYGLNSRVVQVSDEIMGMINNLTQG